MLDKAEKLKAGVFAKMEHPFRVIKRKRSTNHRLAAGI